MLVDGDSTYDASAAPQMIKYLQDHQLDMVNGARITEIKEAYRPGHRFGNWMLTSIVARTFGNRFKDMLSGYRVFSRRYVKSFPSLATGFEIETELTIHALHLRMPIAEVQTVYKDRPSGSTSKLSTFKDGFRILWMILVFIKEEKPMPFFSVLGFFFCFGSIFLMVPILREFFVTGLVPRFPTAILSMCMMVISFLSFSCGLILDTVTRGRNEMKRMQYLNTPLTSTKEEPVSMVRRYSSEVPNRNLIDKGNSADLAIDGSILVANSKVTP